jgi:hypothetical protein
MIQFYVSMESQNRPIAKLNKAQALLHTLPVVRDFGKGAKTSQEALKWR